ncbi:MAG TPA: hypothetical protein VMF29_06975 [Candidatus Edwardsbacteria bacterium]|nr:hypothetical protein [Candidatus Edwardsbacteria bacterium]
MKLRLTHITRSILRRAFLVCAVAGYVACFRWIYLSWLNPNFEYYGFTCHPLRPELLLAAWLLSLLPACWMPFDLHRPSQLIYWIMYLAVYVPSIWVPMLMGLRPAGQLIALAAALGAGFALIGLNYTLPVLKVRARKIPPKLFWIGWWAMAAALTLWVLRVFHGHIRLVSFGQVYAELRFASDELMQGSAIRYAVMWLAGMVYPFVMAWGLVRRRWPMALAGGLGQLLLYATTGAKSAVVSIAVIGLLFLLLGRQGKWFGPKLVLAVIVLMAGLNMLDIRLDPDKASGLYMASSLVFMRIFGIPGLLTGFYQDFFSVHPWTYFSHVSGINHLVRYPYGASIGMEVGNYYYGNPDLNANTHLWGMDGLAGFGLAGILMVSLLCGLAFWLLDSVAADHDRVLAALMVSFTALNIGNMSLFTTMLSGGLGLIIVLLAVMPATGKGSRAGAVEGSHEPEPVAAAGT